MGTDMPTRYSSSDKRGETTRDKWNSYLLLYAYSTSNRESIRSKTHFFVQVISSTDSILVVFELDSRSCHSVELVPGWRSAVAC